MKRIAYISTVIVSALTIACADDGASTQGATSDDSGTVTDGGSSTDAIDGVGVSDGLDGVGSADGSSSAADGSDSVDSSDTVDATSGVDSSDSATGDTASDAADATDSTPDVVLGPNGVPIVQLEPPESGFQVRSLGRFIAPGKDVEYCEVITLPGTPDDVYYVNRIEVAMHPWSHHVIIDAVVPGSETDAGLEDGMVKPCVSAASAYGEDLVDVIGAQSPYSDLDLPDGIGRIYYGGQKVIVDYHYFNPTLEEIPAGHAINFHRVEEADVTHVAENFGFYNFNILTLPGQTSKYAAKCTFKQDVMVSVLTRHTHRWGKDFHIWYEGGENDGEHIWTSNDWELELNYVYDEPRLMKKGEGFRFQCEYENTTDQILTFGPKATDEMCILFGVVWSPDSLYMSSVDSQLPGAAVTCSADSVAPVDMP